MHGQDGGKPFTPARLCKDAGKNHLGNSGAGGVPSLGDDGIGERHGYRGQKGREDVERNRVLE